jgi:predicted alpha-1,6-mannanase (GH76 family)
MRHVWLPGRAKDRLRSAGNGSFGRPAAAGSGGSIHVQNSAPCHLSQSLSHRNDQYQTVGHGGWHRLPGIGEGSTPDSGERSVVAVPDYRARATSAVRALQEWYLPRTGLWRTTGWWNSANALMALIRYIQRTGNRSYAWVVDNTFRAAQRETPGFINTFFDDNAWWALAWVAAYDLTADPRYLAAAQAIFAHNLVGWDDTCGGGLWWNEDRRYKNAITNELFLVLAAQLHQRTPGDQEYLGWALREWAWLRASGMIGAAGLVNDGLANCVNNGGLTWTYNQGVILGGLAALHKVTGDHGYLREGEAIANAALSELAVRGGILAEPSEPTGCDGDQTQFKGIFMRYLHQFSRACGRPEYGAFIAANADSVWDNARSEAGQFGLRWAGPFDTADASRQSSALEVLTAAGWDSP